MGRTQLVWFRDDLRLRDNAALTAAAARGPVVGLHVDEAVCRPIGAAARWWRGRSVASISNKLPLIRAAGDPREVVPRIARELDAEVQQEKFDPRARYVARWVPEALTPLYREPMVDVKESRRRALDAYEEMRSFK